MAAGLVWHNITTSTGVTFAVASWVPDTGSPNALAKAAHTLFDTAGNEVLTAAQVTSLLGYLDGVEATLTAIDGRVDGLETLIAATNAALAGTLTVASHAVTNAGTFVVQPQPSATGGLSVFRSLDLDESEEEVKATAGCLYKLRLTNRATTARYVKLYNDTAANVTVGTTPPIDTIVVPGASSADLATVLTENFGGIGLTFSTALCLAATTAFADADTGAPSANDVIATAYYK